MFSEGCKSIAKEKKLSRFLTNDKEISPHSDKKHFDEENSDE